MSSGISDPTFGTSRTVGRYFGIVSAVPTLLLTAYIYLLIASGAWSDRPDFRSALDTLEASAATSIVLLLGTALFLALTLHTIQFAIVQFLEGYWGGNPIARFMRAARTAAYASRRDENRARFAEANSVLRRTDPSSLLHFRAMADYADAARIEGSYPRDKAHIMPTRLGNLLRKYETDAGRGYDIRILDRATHLALVAPTNHVEYLNDQRNALDLAARLCASGIIATVVTVVLMWPWDLWLFLAFAPYLLAYVSYRGALVAAHHYGAALGALVDLNRFRMYEAMHLRLPNDITEERDQNERMDDAIRRNDESASITYANRPVIRDDPAPEGMAPEA
jgi:hypothetical protein